MSPQGSCCVPALSIVGEHRHSVTMYILKIDFFVVLQQASLLAVYH